MFYVAARRLLGKTSVWLLILNIKVNPELKRETETEFWKASKDFLFYFPYFLVLMETQLSLSSNYSSVALLMHFLLLMLGAYNYTTLYSEMFVET